MAGTLPLGLPGLSLFWRGQAHVVEGSAAGAAKGNTENQEGHMRTRRDLLKGIGGIPGLALAAACSQPTTPAAAPTTAPAAPAPAQTAPPAVAATGSQNSVTFWGAFTGHNADVLQQLVDRFNQSQKDVQVTLQNQNTYE